MQEETFIPKSLVEQIIDQMFVHIEGHEEFDNEAINKLRQLALSGDLKKSTRIVTIIKSV